MIMIMKKIYNIYEKRDSKGEINVLPSKTIPDQSLPLSVLLERAQRGNLDIAGYFRNPEYDSEFDHVNSVPERPTDALDAADQINRMASKVNTSTAQQSAVKPPEPTPSADPQLPPPAQGD